LKKPIDDPHEAYGLILFQ